MQWRQQREAAAHERITSLPLPLPPTRSSVPTGLNAATVIGRSVTIGQACLLRSCTVEDEAVVGDKCVLLEGSLVEKHSGERGLAGAGGREGAAEGLLFVTVVARWWHAAARELTRPGSPLALSRARSAGAGQRAAPRAADTQRPAVGGQPGQVCSGPEQGRGERLLEEERLTRGALGGGEGSLSVQLVRCGSRLRLQPAPSPPALPRSPAPLLIPPPAEGRDCAARRLVLPPRRRPRVRCAPALPCPQLDCGLPVCPPLH